MGVGQGAGGQQFLIDLDFIADAQAVGHLDDVDPVDKGLVVLVVAEGVPLRLVGVGQNHTAEGNCTQTLGAVVVALLGRGQQGVQHLDRRLEHFDEFHQALVGAAQGAGVAVGVGVVLREFFQLADIHLAHQGRDVLVVFIARLGLGNADLLQDRGVQLDHAELADVAVELVQALDRPGRHDAVHVAPRYAVILLENRAILLGAEQAEWRLEDRRALDRVEGHLLHQRLELFRQRGLAATDRAQQVENLLALLQALGRMAEEGDDMLDGVLHAVEVGEGRVALDDLVGKDPRQPRVQRGIDQLWLADGLEQTLRGCGIGQGI